MRGIGVGSPEKLAAAHLNYDRTPDNLKKAEFGAIADDPPSGDPLRKIPEGSLPRSNHPLSLRRCEKISFPGLGPFRPTRMGGLVEL